MARSRPLALPPAAIDRWCKHANGTVSHIAESTGFVSFDLSFDDSSLKRVVSPEHYIITFAHKSDKAGRPRYHSSLLTLRIVPEESLPDSVPIGVEVRGRDGEAIICKGEYVEFELLSKVHEVSSQPPLKIAAGPVRVNAESKQREFMRIDLGRCVRHIVTEIVDDPQHSGQKLSKSRWWICIEVLRLVCTTNSIECTALDDPAATPLEWVICLVEERADNSSGDTGANQNKSIDELARFIDGGCKKSKANRKKKKNDKANAAGDSANLVECSAQPAPRAQTAQGANHASLSKSAEIAAALSSKELLAGLHAGLATSATALSSASAGGAGGSAGLAPRPAPPPGWSRTVDLSPALIDSWRDVAGCEVRNVAEATGFIYFAVNLGVDQQRHHVAPAHYVVAFQHCGVRQQRYQSALLSLRIVPESEIPQDSPGMAAKTPLGSAECVEFELLSRESESVVQTPLRITTGPVRLNERTGQRESMRLDLGAFVRRASPDLVAMEGVLQPDGKQPERFVRQRWWIGLDTLRLVCISNALDCSGLDTPGAAPLEWVICLIDDCSAAGAATGAASAERPVAPQAPVRPVGSSLTDELRDLVEGIGRVVGGNGSGLGGLGSLGGGNAGGMGGLGSLGGLGGLGGLAGLSGDRGLLDNLSSAFPPTGRSASGGSVPCHQSAVTEETDIADANKKKKKKKKKKGEDDGLSDEPAGPPAPVKAAAKAQAAKTQVTARSACTPSAASAKKDKSLATPTVVPAAKSIMKKADPVAKKAADKVASGGQPTGQPKAAMKGSGASANAPDKEQKRGSQADDSSQASSSVGGAGHDSTKAVKGTATAPPNRTLALPPALIDVWCQYARKSVTHVAEASGFVHFALSLDNDKGHRVVSPENYIIAFPHRDKGRQRYHSSLLTLRLVPEADVPDDAARARTETDDDSEHVEFELLSRVHEAPVQQPRRITAGPVRLNPETGQRESMRIDLGRCVRQIATDVIDDSRGRKLCRSRWWISVDTLRLVCTANSLDASALDTPGAAPLEWVICLADERAMQHAGSAKPAQEERDIDQLMKFIDGGKSSAKKKKKGAAANVTGAPSFDAATVATPSSSSNRVAAPENNAATPAPNLKANFAPAPRGKPPPVQEFGSPMMARSEPDLVEDEFHSPCHTPHGYDGPTGFDASMQAQLEALLRPMAGSFRGSAYDAQPSDDISHGSQTAGRGPSLLAAWEPTPDMSGLDDDEYDDDDMAGLRELRGLSGSGAFSRALSGGLRGGFTESPLPGAGASSFGNFGAGSAGLSSFDGLSGASGSPLDGVPDGLQEGQSWDSLLAGLCSEFAQVSQDRGLRKRWEPTADSAVIDPDGYIDEDSSLYR